eukprot:2606101-Pyramimonas_sp.AAC.1
MLASLRKRVEVSPQWPNTLSKTPLNIREAPAECRRGAVNSGSDKYARKVAKSASDVLGNACR